VQSSSCRRAWNTSNRDIDSLWENLGEHAMLGRTNSFRRTARQNPARFLREYPLRCFDVRAGGTCPAILKIERHDRSAVAQENCFRCIHGAPEPCWIPDTSRTAASCRAGDSMPSRLISASFMQVLGVSVRYPCGVLNDAFDSSLVKKPLDDPEVANISGC